MNKRHLSDYLYVCLHWWYLTWISLLYLVQYNSDSVWHSLWSSVFAKTPWLVVNPIFCPIEHICVISRVPHTYQQPVNFFSRKHTSNILECLNAKSTKLLVFNLGLFLLLVLQLFLQMFFDDSVNITYTNSTRERIWYKNWL